MKRSVLLLLTVGALLLGLSACGGAAETPAPTPAAPGGADAPAVSYGEAYLQYMSVFSALSDELERRVETHNALLQTQFPESYYMNSNYLMNNLLPIRPVYPDLGSALTDESLTQGEEALRSVFPDAAVRLTAPGCYEAEYTYIDKTSGQEVSRAGRCLWESDGTGAFRVRAYVDGALAEFTEFIPQGEGLYLIYTTTEKILVRSAPEGITGLWFAHRIHEAPLGLFPGDMRPCSLEERDFYPAALAEQSWITGDGDAQYVITLQGDGMTYAGKVAQDLLDADGEKIAVAWQEIEPITLLR